MRSMLGCEYKWLMTYSQLRGFALSVVLLSWVWLYSSIWHLLNDGEPASKEGNMPVAWCFIHLGNILSNSNENNEAESLREGTSYLRQGIFGKFGLYEWVPLVGHIIGGPSWCGNLQHVKYNSFSILHPTFLYINQMFDFYFRNQTSVRIKVSSLTSSTTLYHISSSQ